MSKETESGKWCLVLLWLTGWIGLIWFLVDEKMRKNNFVKFHFKQWLVVVILSVLISVVYTPIYGVLSVITLGIFALIGWVVYVPFIVWVIQGLIFAFKGEEKELWLVGKWGKKFKF